MALQLPQWLLPLHVPHHQGLEVRGRVKEVTPRHDDSGRDDFILILLQ